MTNTIEVTTSANIELELIEPDEHNRKANIDKAFLATIAQHGVLMPIAVTPIDDGRYRVIAGERRYSAAIEAGHTTIPAVIREVDELTAGVHQAVENLHRRDLTASEEAAACARLLEAGMTRNDLAKNLNRPAKWVRTRLVLAGCPIELQDAVDQEVFPIGAVLKLAAHVDDAALIAHVIENPSRDLEWTIERFMAMRDEAAQLDGDIEALDTAGVKRMDADDVPKRANKVVNLGVSLVDHQQLECHVYVIRARSWGGGRDIEHWCLDPKTHKVNGGSDLAAPDLDADDAKRQADKEARRAAKEQKTVVDDFARDAIGSRIRKADIGELILPVLFANLGETPLSDAAKFLGVTEPESIQGSTHKYWAGPFRTWAHESPANMQRALLAVCHVLGHQAGSWQPEISGPWHSWLERLGAE